MRRLALPFSPFPRCSWGGLLIAAAACCLPTAAPAPAGEGACPWPSTEHFLEGGHTVSQKLSFGVHPSGEIGARMAITFKVEEGSMLTRSEKTILSNIPGASVKDGHVKVTDERGRELASSCKWSTGERAQDSRRASWFKVLFEFPEPVRGSVSRLYTVYLEYTVLRGLCTEGPGGMERFDFPWAHKWVARVTDSSYKIDFPNHTSTELDMEGVCFGGKGMHAICGTSRLDVPINGSSAYIGIAGYVHAPYFKWSLPRAAEMSWGGTGAELCDGFDGPIAPPPGFEEERDSTITARTSMIVFIVGGAIGGGLLGGCAVKKPRRSGKSLGDDAESSDNVDPEWAAHDGPGHSVRGAGSRHIAQIEATAPVNLRGVASPRITDAIMPCGDAAFADGEDDSNNWEVMEEFGDLENGDSPSEIMEGNRERLGFFASEVHRQVARGSPRGSSLARESSSAPSEDFPISDLGDEDLSTEPTDPGVEEDDAWNADGEFSGGELLELEAMGTSAPFGGHLSDRGAPKARPRPPSIVTNIHSLRSAASPQSGEPREADATSSGSLGGDWAAPTEFSAQDHAAKLQANSGVSQRVEHHSANSPLSDWRPPPGADTAPPGEEFIVSSPSAAGATPGARFRGLPFIPAALTHSRSGDSVGSWGDDSNEFDLDDSPPNTGRHDSGSNHEHFDFPPDDESDESDPDSLIFDLDDSPTATSRLYRSGSPQGSPTGR